MTTIRKMKARGNEMTVWGKGKVCRWMIVQYTSKGQRVVQAGRSPSQRAVVEAIYEVCCNQQTAATKGMER